MLNELWARIFTPGYQLTSADVLELVDFWESYPRYFAEIQSAARAIELHPNSVEVEVLDGDSPVWVPMLNFAMPGCSQIHLRGAVENFTRRRRINRLRIDGFCISVFSRWDREPSGGVTFHAGKGDLDYDFSLVEQRLSPALELRGFDSSALQVSGRVCRHVCGLISGLGPTKPRWPSCMHGSDVELHPTDTEAVVTAERAIIRLRAQIAAEKSTPRDGDAAPQEFAHECYVTLVQMASIVNRTKRTLERLVKKQDFPLPDVDGGGGKPNEWRWAVVRPVLESEYGRKLPEVFPGDRFAR